jgi:hypothetical protein
MNSMEKVQVLTDDFTEYKDKQLEIQEKNTIDIDTGVEAVKRIYLDIEEFKGGITTQVDQIRFDVDRKIRTDDVK